MATQVKFQFLGKELVVSEERARYAELWKKYEQLATDKQNEYKEYYDHFDGMDEVHEAGLNFGYKAILEAVDISVDYLVENGVLDINKDLFISKFSLGDDLSANIATMICSAVQFFLYFPVDKLLFRKPKEE